jgi:copper oxidase (laccase) domain-containing protein
MEQAIGVAHAGWRGTVGEIAATTLLQMVESYGSKPSYIKAYIGPSISCANFEVGDDVVSEFMKLDLSDCISRKEGAKAHIDLWLANSILLQRAGVPSHHITVAGICTVDHTDQFYSARKEGFDTGRFGLFAMLKREEVK